MPESLARKAPGIWRELESILKREQVGTARVADSESALYRVLKEASHIRYTRLARASVENWLEIRDKARSFPSLEFRDDFTELRRDTDVLRARIEVLSKGLVSTEKKVQELSQEVLRLRLLGKKMETSAVSEVCEAYIEEVKDLHVVREVLLSRCEDDDVSVIWTIIEGPPFDDSVRLPIYEAQLKILKSLKEDTLVDFHVLNLSEFPEKQSVENILPPDTDILWQR
jgi:predicted DNA-binding protein